MKKNEPTRPRPYIWPSWITGILAGTDKCTWRAWYKAHYRYEKTAEDPEREAFFREWTAKHDAITNRRADELKSLGYVVKVEDEGAFKLAGNSVDISGKPDLVAMHDDGHAIVVDAKAGKRRQSDHWQVLLYMFALPLTWLKGYRLQGQVEYHDGREDVRPMSKDVENHIIQTVKTISGPDAPVAVPSATECKFCDIAHCPVRYTRSHTGTVTNLF